MNQGHNSEMPHTGQVIGQMLQTKTREIVRNFSLLPLSNYDHLGQGKTFTSHLVKQLQ
jgi:hypothetical protein